MLPSKIRLVIGVENTPMAVRLVPHKTDEKKLMIKGSHPEAPGAFLQLGGITPGELIQGSNFFMVEVSRKEFLLALPTIMAKILEADVREVEPKKLPLNDSDDY